MFEEIASSSSGDTSHSLILGLLSTNEHDSHLLSMWNLCCWDAIIDKLDDLTALKTTISSI